MRAPARPWAEPRPGGVLLAGALTALAVAAATPMDLTFAIDAAHAPRALVLVGQFVTAFGTSGYMFAFSGLIAVAATVTAGRGQPTWGGWPARLVAERALFVFAAVAASGLVDQLLKHVIGRARPALLAVDGPYSFHPLSAQNVLASFPSGHTTSAFAAAVALGYMRPSWRPAFLAAAALVGASRVLVGAHYPSDVVGGAALGSAVAVALARDFARRGLAFPPQAVLRSPRPPAARPEALP